MFKFKLKLKDDINVTQYFLQNIVKLTLQLPHNQIENLLLIEDFTI